MQHSRHENQKIAKSIYLNVFEVKSNVTIP